MKLREAITKAHERGIKWNPTGWYSREYLNGTFQQRCCLLGAAVMGCDPTLVRINGGKHVRDTLGIQNLDPIIQANDGLFDNLFMEWLDNNPAPHNSPQGYVEWLNNRTAERQRILKLSLTEVMDILSEDNEDVRTLLETEVCKKGLHQ